MSEEVSASEAEPTAGALLRRAREQAGLHLDVLAGSLKVPPRQLEALEMDRIDLLPDVVFARALAASVCRNLKVSPRVVLDRLPQS
ncbi:MAG: helix-turn-helix transcriptional regulator, partial [Pseudomonadota bacterium]